MHETLAAGFGLRAGGELSLADDDDNVLLGEESAHVVERASCAGDVAAR